MNQKQVKKSKKYIYLMRIRDFLAASHHDGTINDAKFDEMIEEVQDLIEKDEKAVVAYIETKKELKNEAEQIERERIIEKEVAFQELITKLLDEDKLEEAKELLMGW